jgi:hypothetical protein
LNYKMCGVMATVFFLPLCNDVVRTTVSTAFVKSSRKCCAKERNGSGSIMTTTTTDPLSQPRRYCDKRLEI